MEVLFAASESVPFAKSGGLADVVGSLPNTLQEQGVHVSVILPKYQDISSDFKGQMHSLGSYSVSVGWRDQNCELYYLNYQETDFYFVENDYYFDRPGLYGYDDEAERFAFFSQAVVDCLLQGFLSPQVVHCHDWHTGMIPVLLDDLSSRGSLQKRLATVFTIHNLKYQGVFPQNILDELFNLDRSYFTIDKLEYFGNVNFMKGGIAFSEIVTTVSPTYAQEIQTPHFGEDLDGFLRANAHKLTGIINGIDYEYYNPADDPHIEENFDVNDLTPKLYNKRYLQRIMDLPVDDDLPILCIVTRLTSQKGIELISRVIHELLSCEVQVVVLGTGEHHYEEQFRHIESQYRHKLRANIKYDEQLAKQIFAGADFSLIPSNFEPCGLTQMISMRYGTIPIVREIGGLKDTVTPYNQYTGQGDGFSFTNYNAHEMLHVFETALQYYHKTSLIQKMRITAMSQDFSWNSSASKYRELYGQVIETEAN